VIIFAYGIVKCLSGKTFRAILRIFYQYRPRFHTETRRANAAINIKVAGGQSETLNGRGGQHKTSVKEAASREASTQRSVVQLSLFDLPVITVRPRR